MKKSFICICLILLIQTIQSIQKTNERTQQQTASNLLLQDMLSQTYQRVYESNVKSLSLRLTPNQDIQQSLHSLIAQRIRKNKTALSIVSAVGSVKYCWIRYANSSTLTKVQGPLQIVSLSGTLDWIMKPHIHISVANGNGVTFGGHLPSISERNQTSNYHSKGGEKQAQNSQIGFGCPIFTTLELSLLSHENIIFQRKVDPQTTFDELTIRKKSIF